MNARNIPTSEDWLDIEVRTRHGYLSFQQPDKIADAIRLITNIDLWNLVSAKINIDPKDLKRRLALLVDRRNKISHESDLNPSFPGERWPIDLADVSDAADFIDTIVEAIDEATR